MNFNEYRIDPQSKIETEISVTYRAVKNEALFAIKQAKTHEHDPLVVAGARTQMGLDHPNIVKVLNIELDSETGRPFVVMEYVDSPTLDSIISSELEIPFEQKLSIINDIAEAIAYAHKNGVPHGDLCPKNIFVGNPAKITDFCPQRIQQYFNNSIEIRASTPLIANQLYLAPEQKANPVASKKSDIYAFGLCVIELLAGSRIVDISKKEWPESIKQIIMTSTSKNPDERQDISGILLQLEEAKQEYFSRKKGHNASFHRVLGPESHLRVLISKGDIIDAYKMIKEKSNLPIGAKSILLKATLMLKHPLKWTLLIGSTFGEISDAVISLSPTNYKKVKRHARITNDFAIAAAYYNPEVAIEIFKYLLPVGRRDIINNNLGAVLASQSNPESLNYLQKSNLDEAKFNSALFHFCLGNYDDSLKLAEEIVVNPMLQAKAGAIIEAINRKPLRAHPTSAMAFLTRKFAEEFLKGVNIEHYEFVRETEVI